MRQTNPDLDSTVIGHAMVLAVSMLLLTTVVACNGDGNDSANATTTTTSLTVHTQPPTTSTTMGGRVHACCIPGHACQEMREGVCLAMGGEWEPAGSDPLCTPGLCRADATTTTSSTTTSTWIIVDDFPASIHVTLLDAVTVGALQLDIANNGPGQFVGQADIVSCTIAGLLAGQIVAFNHDVAQSVLHVGIVSLGGFTGPGELFVCSYDRSFQVNAAQFPVTVVDATTPDFSPIVPVPSIEIAVDWIF